jgi:replication factor A1
MSGLRPATFVKLEGVAPQTHGHNILVKVLEKKVVVKRDGGGASKAAGYAGVTRVEECLVGDETGCILFTAKNGELRDGMNFLLRCGVSVHVCQI